MEGVCMRVCVYYINTIIAYNNINLLYSPSIHRINDDWYRLSTR